MTENITLATNLSENLTSIDSSAMAANVTNSTNQVFLNSVEQWTGIGLADSFVYFVVMASIFLILWLISRSVEMRRGNRIIFSSSIFLASEALITEFGTYTIQLPFGGEYITNRFVHIFELLDWVFSFGLFQHFGIPIVNEYTMDMVNTEPTGMLFGLVAVLSFGDTIFQIILLSFGMYAVLTLIENKFNFQFPFQRVLSVLLGATPSIIMAMSYSNPIEEFETSKSIVMVGLYFVNTTMANGGWLDFGFVMMLLMASLMLIYYFLGIIVDMFLSTYININPKGKEIDYKVSISSVTSMIVILYSAVFLFHPEYPYYKILTVLLFMTFFKKFLDSVVRKAKTENNERRRQQRFANLVAERIKTPATVEYKNDMRVQTAKDTRRRNWRNFWIPMLISILFIGLGGLMIIY